MPKISVLRYYRKKQKLTVKELALELSIPFTTLKAFERQSRRITEVKATLIAQYFNVDPSTLIGKQVIDIPLTEYHNLYRPNSVYIPAEIKVHNHHKKLIDSFLYGKRPSSNKKL